MYSRQIWCWNVHGGQYLFLSSLKQYTGVSFPAHGASSSDPKDGTYFVSSLQMTPRKACSDKVTRGFSTKPFHHQDVVALDGLAAPRLRQTWGGLDFYFLRVLEVLQNSHLNQVRWNTLE